MPTSTVDILGTLNTNIAIAWAWALGVIAVLFLFALGTGALKGGLRSVMRHVRSAFRF